jgi:hypothetical protein
VGPVAGSPLLRDPIGIVGIPVTHEPTIDEDHKLLM